MIQRKTYCVNGDELSVLVVTKYSPSSDCSLCLFRTHPDCRRYVVHRVRKWPCMRAGIAKPGHFEVI